jgi:catechol 2,3-dioxygenase-like lactoylglutathione lyase family enzyme
MNIIGPDCLVFGVDDLAACARFGRDYGLVCSHESEDLVVLEALDGTCLEVRLMDDPLLPPPVTEGPNLRLAIYGVADAATLAAIRENLSRDREVTESGGRVFSHDDDGYPIAFQITRRHGIDQPAYGVNCPGTAPGRGVNQIAAIDEDRPTAYTLSHFVLFTPDRDRAERFYADRLGFRTVDYFTNLGPFMRPAGTNEHHTLFLIQAPKLGMQHFAFHFAGANELLKAGWEMMARDWPSNWGPGRHILGSNYFWYFESPFGCLMEMDADMDLHDDSWVPRHMVADEITSQTFILQYKPKHSPAAEKRRAEAADG